MDGIVAFFSACVHWRCVPVPGIGLGVQAPKHAVVVKLIISPYGTRRSLSTSERPLLQSLLSTSTAPVRCRLLDTHSNSSSSSLPKSEKKCINNRLATDCYVQVDACPTPTGPAQELGPPVPSPPVKELVISTRNLAMIPGKCSDNVHQIICFFLFNGATCVRLRSTAWAEFGGILLLHNMVQCW
jgi:hypothetical protein